MVPKRLRFASSRYRLDRCAVLDVGCGPGQYLRHFGSGSVGIDINAQSVRSEGLEAVDWNFVEPVPAELHDRFDAVWASNIIEHVLSPHETLIHLRPALRPDGVLLVAVPHTTPFTRSAWHGYLASDHIGFFTPLTLAHTIRRAGYDVEFVGSPSVPWLPRALARLLGHLGPTLLAAARRIDNWQYPPKSHKRLVNGEIEWRSTLWSE